MEGIKFTSETRDQTEKVGKVVSLWTDVGEQGENKNEELQGSWKL